LGDRAFKGFENKWLTKSGNPRDSGKPGKDIQTY